MFSLLKRLRYDLHQGFNWVLFVYFTTTLIVQCLCFLVYVKLWKHKKTTENLWCPICVEQKESVEHISRANYAEKEAFSLQISTYSRICWQVVRILYNVRGKIMYFSFGQILNLFYWFRPSFCVLFVLLLDRLSGKEWWTSCSIQIVVIQIFVIIVEVTTTKSELLIYHEILYLGFSWVFGQTSSIYFHVRSHLKYSVIRVFLSSS